MKYLLPKPVHGKITELVDTDKAWLDLGSESGLLPGMTLYCQGKSRYKIRIEKSEKKKSLAVLSYESDSMQVGDKVSSQWQR